MIGRNENELTTIPEKGCCGSCEHYSRISRTSRHGKCNAHGTIEGENGICQWYKTYKHEDDDK